MTGHVNGRLMASRARSFANLAPILAALFLVALPAFAADCCPAATQDVNTLSVDQIRDLQKCLLQGGYYVGNNASEVDGAIGKRTLAALDKASQNCSSPAPPAPPDGNVVCCSPAIQKKIVQLHNGEELTSTENRIAFSRQAYNDGVMEYNTSREQFPGSVIANMFTFKTAELLQATEAPNERQPVKVTF